MAKKRESRGGFMKENQIQDRNLVVYMSQGQEVKLSPALIRKYLVNNPAVTDQEVLMFLQLCRFRKLNPWLKEAYLVKYGDNPAQIIVGKDAFTTRASQMEECLGWEAGVVYIGKDGKMGRSMGIVPPGCDLTGGWGRVYRKGWKKPLEIEVNLDELIGKKANGELNKIWAKMPSIMIRKCLVVAVLREAFSGAFGQMYIQEEMNVDVPDINIPDKVVNENTSGRNVTPPKDKASEKSPEDRSWEEHIRAKLGELKGKPMGGMQKVWEDVSEKIGTMDRETAKLRVHKLYVLQDVVPGPDTDAYIKAISAAVNIEELSAAIKKYKEGPLDEKIFALTKKILEFVETKDPQDKEAIIVQIDKIGKGKNKEMVLSSLEKYARQIGAMGVEDEGIY
jgi:phage recombination protein Bet